MLRFVYRLLTEAAPTGDSCRPVLFCVPDAAVNVSALREYADVRSLLPGMFLVIGALVTGETQSHAAVACDAHILWAPLDCVPC